MKLIIFVIVINTILGIPIQDDRIYFCDDNNYANCFYEAHKEVDSSIDDRTDDLKLDLSQLLNDPNILQSDSETSFNSSEDHDEGKLQYGELFQGDIILMPDQIKFLDSPDDGDLHSARTGLLSLFNRWPKDKDGKVIVPYTYSSEYTPNDKTLVRRAMNDIEKYTCIRFKPHKNQNDHIFIYSGGYCSSYLGKIGGRQLVSLNTNGCMSHGTIMHELIHALGFDHMQNRADRNQHVTVLWYNIPKDRFINFKEVDPKKFNDFGTPYDFYSVMHYISTAFSRNDRRTIISKEKRYRNIIGQRYRLSTGDAQRLNAMYECEVRK